MGGKTGTTSSATKIPPEVLARYNSVNTRAEDVAAKPFQQYGTTPDAFVAQLNQQQKTGQAGMNQYANAAQPVLNQVQQGYTPEGFSQGVKGYMNPYLESAVASTRNQMQNVAGQQQAQMKGSAIGQGAFGGDRANIGMGNLINQQNLALGQTIGGMESQGFQNAAQNYMSGLGQRGQTALAAQQAGLQGSQAQIGAGTLGQQTEQAGKTALYNQFLQEQAYPYQVAQFLGNIAMGTGALSGSNTTTTQPMSFFSDERLKEGIEKIGKTFDGQDIIKFRYKGEDGPKQIGLSAQNVEKHHPEAVGLAKGYKTVDYDAATKESARRGHFEEGGLVSEGGAVGMQHMGQGFADGGGAYDPYDPYSIYNILSRQQGFFDSGDRSHVPSARGLSGGIGKHGRVPEASLPVGRLMVAAPPPAPLESGMSQMMNAANTGETISKMFETNEKTGESGLGRKAYDFLKSLGEKNKEKEARGGLVGYATGGMPYDLDSDPKKLDIPDDTSKFKMPEQKHLPGTMQDPTMSDIMKLVGMFSKASGGRAGYEGGGAPEDELGRYLGAIAKIESGGQKDPYAALGPVTKKGDRAYGKYQVMGANIPSWTEEALGQKMTPDEYLANEDAQEKVARHYFGKSLDKYGNPEDAASIWFTGKPRAEAGNVADILGTTNSNYVRKFNEALGRPTEPSEAPRKRDLGDTRADLPAERARAAGDFNVPGEKADKDSKKGFFDELLQEKYVVPALAGVGSMLSSRSPFFLPALGEGLAGASAAYMGQQKTRAGIGLTEAETKSAEETAKAIEAQTIQSAIIGNDIRIIGPNGDFQFIPKGVYYSKPTGTFRIAAFSKQEQEDIKNGIMPKGFIRPTGQAGMGTPSFGEEKKTPVVAGLAPPSFDKTADIDQTFPKPSDAKVETSELSPATGLAGGEQGPKVEQPKTDVPPNQPMAKPSKFAREEDPNVIDKAVREAVSGYTSDQLATVPQTFAEAKQIQQANMAVYQNIRTLAGDFASLPREGSLLTPGTIAPYTRKIAEFANSIASSFGREEPFVNPADVRDVSSIDKTLAQLSTELRAANKVQAAIGIDKMREMLPTISQPQEGIAKNLAAVLVNMKQQNDFANYLQSVRDLAADRLKGQTAIADRVPDLPSTNWSQRFKEKTSSQYAQDQLTLEKMYFDGFADTTKPKNPNGKYPLALDQETGRPISVFGALMKHPQSFSQEQLRAVKAKYGENILDYFNLSTGE